MAAAPGHLALLTTSIGALHGLWGKVWAKLTFICHLGARIAFIQALNGQKSNFSIIQSKGMCGEVRGSDTWNRRGEEEEEEEEGSWLHRPTTCSSCFLNPEC